jgi:hypothetical protein
MKVAIDETEWYPVFTLDTDLEWSVGIEVDVEASLFNEYTELMDKFDDMQTKLREVYRGNKKNNK